jgi:FlaG/FlaF family flagellin (archaellin)
LKERKNRSRKAVSVVIATVILVSVTIALAFVAAYWISGIVKHYIKFEKIEIQSGICTWHSNATYWKITVKLKNTGTAKATLISGFINDVEIATYYQDSVVASSASTNMSTSTSLNSGASIKINIYLDEGYASLSSRTTVNIKIHCAGGREYIIPIELV